VPYVEQCLKEHEGPVIAATDYMKTYAEQVRPFLPRRFRVLGTDGFGRSDYRVKLRQFFEVNRFYIAIASLKALADEGTISPVKTAEAIKKYGINPDRPNPVTV
jgi:pyruvate dehydrogenase E1 component